MASSLPKLSLFSRALSLSWAVGVAISFAISYPYSHDLAYTTALSALVMFLSMLWTARSLHRLFSSHLEEDLDSPRSSVGAMLFMFKLPLLALALAGILWYMPRRPDGVLIGVLLTLLAAVIAAAISTKKSHS